MHTTLGRVSVGLGALVGIVGVVLSTPVSGFLSSLVFYGLLGGLIAAIGLDRADRRRARR